METIRQDNPLQTERCHTPSDIFSNFSQMCDAESVANEDVGQIKPAVPACLTEPAQQPSPLITENRIFAQCKELKASEQRSIIRKLITADSKNPKQAGVKKYLIHAHWWRRWCDFVNFS